MPDRPQDPLPLEPRGAQVVDGVHVRLRWQPPEGAESLRLEVAEDPAFTHIACAEDLPPGAAERVLQRCFPERGRTIYWRVRARGEEGWSPGERIESFISGTADEVLAIDDRDADEDLGPVPELFRVARLQGMAELTPGRQPEAERAVGGRPEGVEGAQIVTIGMVFVVAAVVLVVSALLLLFFAG